ncbi:hypothetical protein CHS0354_040524 [Potamilus streckersoni]|uniref:L-Fucosyltransferase n=1 Tax=Potamilus streckersoni TaxID=2493646 RepID=A0AAE0WEM7_9BIVA|nr:hypothetical protein CHS0354_040524 [Potamilus streckersoni]
MAQKPIFTWYERVNLLWKNDCFRRRKHQYTAVLMCLSTGVFVVYALRYNNIPGLEVLPKFTLPMVKYGNLSVPDNIGNGVQTNTSLQSSHYNQLFATDETKIISTQLIPVRVTLLPEILNVSTSGFSANKKMVTNSKVLKETHFMTISGNGRLGNTMFQFAALLSCAKRLNYTAFIRPDHLISQYYLISGTSSVSLINVEIAGEKAFGKYDNELESLNTSKNWSLGGYYQSWKYFYKDEDLIRSSFNFKPDIYEKARQFVDSYRQGNRTIVGIHVRRGDMSTSSADASGYSAAPITYIKKSMNYFKERYSNALFIVVSDEIPWCKENLKEDNGIAFISFNNPGTDMAVLSLCDHVIVTSGTFGWWGAWLAGGDVVYFKGFPKPGSQLDRYISREDYYPPHWIGL